MKIGCAGGATEKKIMGAMPEVLFEEKGPVNGLVSMAILTFNQLKYTKECIKSIRRHTPEPHQIVFVDNGSTDGTVKWLRRIIKENSNYRLIENTKNLGFAKGCNQGILKSSGEYILLLNNNVVVSEGWLSGMLECLSNTSDAGIVGPMTNNISGPQKVANANYASMNLLDEYARTFREINRYRRIPSRKIAGFCMLFKRELAEKIGLLDESFGSGNFEDDDFCLRATLEGYRNFIAGDVFIHHYGSVSFIGNKIHCNSSIGKDKKIFDEKWRNIDVSSPHGKKLAVLNKLESAEKFYQRQQIDQAIPTIIDGIKYSPDDKAIYYRLAEMLIDSKRFNDAMDALKSMPEEGKKEARRHALAGYGKEGMGLYAEAGDHADQALSLNAGCASALNLKGILAYKKGDKNSADDHFRKAVKCDPGYGEPYTNLGILKWDQGDREDAVNLLEKGFILSPTIADIVSIYHSAITSVGDLERAEQRFREAKASYPLNKRIAFLLIDILIRQGKNEIAMQEIERAMISFGTDDGMLAAALEIRKRIGAREGTDKSKKSGTLSVCMIVKNEENHIAKCLMSAQPVADEMIVVDTGSADRTRDIAAAFGAGVFGLPWTDDFSGARNFSLSKASGDWIFVLDADEVISSRDYPLLKSIILKKCSNPAAYNIATRNYVRGIKSLGWVPNKGEYPLEETGTGWFPSVKVRLFPNDGRIRFEGHVHETVESSIITAGIKIKQCRIIVHHYGKMSTGKLISKGERYYLLGRKKLKERPDDVKSLSELAIQAQELKRFEEAIALWKRAIDLTGEKPAARFFFDLGYCCLQTEQYEKALLASKRAMEIDPTMKEALLNYTYSELLVGDYKKVISELEPLLERAVEYPPASLLLAAAYGIAGQKDKAVIFYKALFKKGFIIADTLHILCKRLVALGKTGPAVRALEALIESGKGNDETGRLLDECLKQSPAILPPPCRPY